MKDLSKKEAGGTEVTVIARPVDVLASLGIVGRMLVRPVMMEIAPALTRVDRYLGR